MVAPLRFEVWGPVLSEEDPTDVNLAFGTCYESGTLITGDGPDALNDGVGATLSEKNSWVAVNPTPMVTRWWTDLGSTFTVETMDLVRAEADNDWNYTNAAQTRTTLIQGSEDGVSWTTLSCSINEATGEVTMTDPESWRWFRVETTEIQTSGFGFFGHLYINTWAIWGAAPPTTELVHLATLDEAFGKTFRVELDGPGFGQFVINRHDPDAIPTVLREDNVVLCYIPEVSSDPLFGWLIETGDFVIATAQGESGKEDLTFSGRGLLAYLDRGMLLEKSYLTDWWATAGTTWYFNLSYAGNLAGQIFWRIIEEFQTAARPQHPIPLVSMTFDDTLDSSGDAWGGSAIVSEWTGEVGERGMSLTGRLLGTGELVVQMRPPTAADPLFKLDAYNPANYGRDLSSGAFGAGVVRFERGVNIVEKVSEQKAPMGIGTHALVGGDTLGDHPPDPGSPPSRAFAYAELVGGEAHLPVREQFVAAKGTDEDVLELFGLADLAQRLRRHRSVSFPIVAWRGKNGVGDHEDGFYLPGPEGTDGNFWVGDIVRGHTGTSVFDLNEVDLLVAAFTVEEGPAAKLASDLVITPELGSTRLWPSGDRGGTNLGTRGGSGGYPGTGIATPPGGGGGTPGPHVHPPTPHELEQHTDVDVSTPQADGDVLAWDAASSTWIPAPASGVTTLDGLSDVDVAGAVAGDRLRFDGADWRHTSAVWRQVMFFDPVTEQWLGLVDGDGDAVMVEV